MKPSNNALQLIKNREQCRLTSYKLKGESHYTIGWGHYCDRTPSLDCAGARITQAQADAFLAQDVAEKTAAINSVIKISIPQNLYDSLVSTTYQYNPNNSTLKAIFRAVNMGYSVSQVAAMLLSMPSNNYNKKARKADSILATLGRVVHLETLKV